MTNLREKYPELMSQMESSGYSKKHVQALAPCEDTLPLIRELG